MYSYWEPILYSLHVVSASRPCWSENLCIYSKLSINLYPEKIYFWLKTQTKRPHTLSHVAVRTMSLSREEEYAEIWLTHMGEDVCEFFWTHFKAKPQQKEQMDPYGAKQSNRFFVRRWNIVNWWKFEREKKRKKGNVINNPQTWKLNSSFPPSSSWHH